MGIVVPVNLTDPSPDWGARIQAALFSTIDAHDHSAGKGVKITPAGLLINADLDFGSFNAKTLRSSRYTSQGAPLALGSDVGCVYVSAGELWYNDLASHKVQLTNLGAVNVAPQALLIKSVSISYTILAADTFQLFYCHTTGSPIALALPSSAGVSAGRVYYIEDADGNAAANQITVTPNGGDTINGTNAPITIYVNWGLLVITTDGAGHWVANIVPPQMYQQSTIALGGAGGGTNVPTALQLRSQILLYTGTLTSNLTIQLPNAPGSYTFDFSILTLGANTIAFKSGTTTSATLAAAQVGSTATTNQLTFVVTYGTNTVKVKA